MAVTWMKTGKASEAIAEQEKVAAEKRKEEKGKMFRFLLKEGEEAPITFVDGALSPEGYLLPPRYYEHQIYMNGSWNNVFVCPEKTNPESGAKCPLCESGDRPSLVALFTVIDHRIVQSKDGQKTYTDRPRLLVAKPATFELLNKVAIKRGGLAGARFDVSRVGENSASVGSMFDFMEKHPIEELQAKYVQPVKDDKGKVIEDKFETFFVPADYESEIIFRTEEELRALGLGKLQAKPANASNGTQKAAGGVPAKGLPAAQSDDTDYEKEL